MNWVVDPQTGQYNATFPTPTGIPSDPTLASYGVQQSKELAAHLQSLDPPVDLIYSSPWYRCLQTLAPFTDQLAQRSTASSASGNETEVRINVEPGVGEFFGLARFEHPAPAPIDELRDFFQHLQDDRGTIITPSPNGESIPQLHNRVAYCLHELIKRADADPSGPRSLLICTHAAVMIAIGRALTGRMPNDEGEEDFKCFTCAFSKYHRKDAAGGTRDVSKWTPAHSEQILDVDWRDGKGVAGGWTCEINGDCSFLTNGEERGWKFSGDESFLQDPNAFNDSANLAGVIKEASIEEPSKDSKL